MSEQREFAPSDFHRAKIDDLITTYTTVIETTEGDSSGQKKKSKLKTVSKTARKEFIDSWVALVEADGLNEETMGLMCNGFRIAQAEPLYRYFEKTKDDSIYKKVETLSCIRKGKDDIGLRVYLSLLSQELVAPSTESSINTVTSCLNRVVIGKRSQIKKYLRQYLTDYLEKNGFSDQAKMGVAEARQLKDTFVKALEEDKGKPTTRSARMTKTPFERTAAPLLEWLTSQIEGVPVAILAQDPVGIATEENIGSIPVPHADDETASTEQSVAGATPESNTNTSADSKDAITGGNPGTVGADAKPAEKGTIPVSVTARDDTAERVSSGTGDNGDATPNRETSAGAPGSSATAASNYSAGINDIPSIRDIIGYLRTYQIELTKQKDRIRSLEDRISSLSRLNSERGRSIQSIQAKYDELSEQYETLKQNYSAIHAQCSALQEENNEKERMLKDFTAEASRDREAFLSKLGKELQQHYENCQYATISSYEEMDEENRREAYNILRISAQKILRILGANGIKFREV